MLLNIYPHSIAPLFATALILVIILDAFKIKVFEFIFKIIFYLLKYGVTIALMMIFIAILRGIKGS